MQNEILIADLTGNDLPAPNADWGTISRFALSFNGYEYWSSFEKCSEIANKSASVYAVTKNLPDSLAELRTCLFFEQRRWRHFGYEPNEQSMSYIRALVEGIREKLLVKDIE